MQRDLQASLPTINIVDEEGWLKVLKTSSFFRNI